MRIVVLATQGSHTDTMVNYLDDAGFAPVSVLIEPAQSKRAMLKARARRLGWVSVAGQLCFMVLVPPVLRRVSGGRLAEVRKSLNLRDDPLPQNRMTAISSVNAPETVEMLRELNPDAVILSGTRIVKADTLQATEAPVLNIHAGITPWFRGVHGGYWALQSRQNQDFGATVHFVDRGVDTGAVLAHVRPTPDPQDNFVTYPLLQLGHALPALVTGLNQIAKGQGLFEIKPNAASGRQWYHPTLWQYLSGLWRGVR